MSMPERLDVFAPAASGSGLLCGGAGKVCRKSGGPVDAFSEILSGVKLNGALFFSAEFSAPWGFLTPPPSVIADEFAPQGMEHLVLYHFVVDGGASVRWSTGHHEALRKLPATSDMNRNPPSIAHSSVSSVSLQADTAAITGVLPARTARTIFSEGLVRMQ